MDYVSNDEIEESDQDAEESWTSGNNLMNREKYGEAKVTSDLNSWSKTGLITVGLWSNKK